MGEKSHGGATTAAEREERIRYAVARICTYTDDAQSITAIADKFGCDRRTAGRYLRAAKALVGAGLPAEIDAWRTLVRSTLLWLLQKEGEDSNSIRATLKQITDLLGLDAPSRSEFKLSGPASPLEAYRKDPSLLERALQVGRDIENARRKPDSHPVSPGSNGNRGLPVSAPPAIPGTSGNGDTHKPGQE